MPCSLSVTIPFPSSVSQMSAQTNSSANQRLNNFLVSRCNSHTWKRFLKRLLGFSAALKFISTFVREFFLLQRWHCLTIEEDDGADDGKAALQLPPFQGPCCFTWQNSHFKGRKGLTFLINPRPTSLECLKFLWTESGEGSLRTL